MAKSGAAALAVVLLVTMALVQGSMAARYVVGDSSFWQLPTDPNLYQTWANRHNPYFSTDFLEFQWIATDSVLQVDFAAFNACNTAAPIKSWAANGDGSITTMVFPLRDSAFRTVYFISGDAGHCLNGQKLRIDVAQ